MSIFIDKNKLFLVEIKGHYIFDSIGNNIGFKIKESGDINLTALAAGRDFESMSKIIEDASIINAVNGKPLLRSSVFCKSILLSFFREIRIKSENENAVYPVNLDLINKMQYDIVKNLASRWLEITDGR
jgi:hypothetical protein